MNLCNLDIRKAIAIRRIKHYEVATALGISQYTFSHWMQIEMPKEKKELIFRAIQSIKK